MKKHNIAWITGSLVAALATIGILAWQQRDSSIEKSSVSLRPRSDLAIEVRKTAAVAATTASTVASEQKEGTTASNAENPSATALPSPEGLWNQPVLEPQFARFKEWVSRYTSTELSQKQALEQEGQALAAERRDAMRSLIQNDPLRALELAVPFSVERQLPAVVQTLLETRVSGRGSLEIFGALPAPGKAHLVTPMFHKATIAGRTFDAFIYGRRSGEPTRRNAILNGVVIENLMAVNENPLRLLDSAEATSRLPSPADAVCTISGNPATANNTPVAADVGGETFLLCGPSHALALNTQLVQAEVAAANGDSQPSEGGNVAASAQTEGTKKLILIRVDFSDMPGTPFNDTTGIDLISGLNTFFMDMSYGRSGFALNGSGSTITATLRMPQTAASYGSGENYFQLRTDARSAAIAAGHSLGNFDYELYCFNDIPGWYWAGLGYVGASGVWLNGYFSVGVAGHELGHNYGLNHANFWDARAHSVLGSTNASSEEYGDNLDTMGSANGGSYHFNARYKSYLNWLRSSNVTTVASSSIHRIHAHDDPSTNGIRALKIARSSGSNYWVEFRQKFTGNKWLMNGVGLRLAGNGNEKSQLLDTTPGSTDGKSDAALVIGRTYSDITAGVHITPLRKGGTTPESIDVAVNLGTFPGNAVPTVTLDAAQTETSTGITLNFSASATDTDGDTLAYYWDFGDGTFGTNGSAAGKIWPSSGEYVVRCVVSDMKGHEASDSVVITVGTPGTYSIRGTVTANSAPLINARVSASFSKYAYTDSDGSYVIAGLSPASYNLSVTHASYDTFTPSGFSNPVSVGPSRTAIDFIGEGGTTGGGGGSVTLTSPSSGNTYTAPATVSMSASATATLGQIVNKVEFFQGVTKLGEDPLAPYTLTWSSAPAGTYTLSARSTDTAGYSATSAPVNITIHPQVPTITSQPQSKSVIAGTNVTFSVTVSGSAPFTYRWRLNGTNIAGAVSSSLTLNNVQPQQAGAYSILVTNVAGSVASSSANLIVTCAYATSESGTAFSSAGGSGAVLVSTAGSCSWDVQDVPSWISVTSASSFTGNGTVSYAVAANTNSSSRTATLDIAGRNYTVSQGGPDLTIPTVSFSTPSSSATITSVVVTVTGTARDNNAVAQVEIAVGAGGFATATGTENWTANVTLQPGTNILSVRSTDLSGNLSATNTRSVFCSMPSSLNLTVNGAGSVAGATNGQRFPIGMTCKLTAIPLPGYVFSNWAGHVSSASPALTFLMASNLQIEANFVSNPFTTSKGVFNGLFYEDDQVRLGQSGFFSLTLSDKGAYSAYVQLGTRKTKASGKLTLNGRATNVVTRPGTNALIITWAVGLDGSDQITGTVGDGTWTADLLGDRATFHKTNAAPQVGNHTLLLLGSSGDLAPEGDSYGTASVDAAGVVKLKAYLADKSSITGKVPLSKNGQWPLYAPLYGGKGALLGWATFSDQPSTDFEGVMSWIKPAIPGPALYPDGFSSEAALLGSRYTPASGNTNRVLNFSNAVVLVSGGNLPASYTNDVLLGASGKVTNSGPNSLTMNFTPSSGLFSGSFVPAGVAKGVAFRGVALQKANIAGGYFLGTNTSGRIALEAPPLSPSLP